ncbi:hypothetical protein ACFL44_01295, partial [Gemmatimonadota bacterium]
MKSTGLLAFLWVAGPILIVVVSTAVIWIIAERVRRNRLFITICSLAVILSLVSGVVLKNVFWKTPSQLLSGRVEV